MNQSKPTILLFSLLLILALGGSAWAQTATGTVSGTVKDSSGAIIPGAEVTIIHPVKNGSRSAVTDGEGRFRMSSVPSGSWRAEARLTGFATSRTEFELDVAGRAQLNFTLQVGEVTTVTEVTGVQQLVNTAEGTLSAVVQERYIQELPLNGRNVYTLALSMPAVTNGRQAGIGSIDAGMDFNVAGVRSRGNNISLDGVTNNDPLQGGSPALTPNLDTVEEFRIQANNFSAEYGRNNGSVINIVTKSGTNAVHGTAYWYHRNDALDAREIFDDDIAPLRQHQAGFTVGGPIMKDRAFFFFGFEGFHTTTGESEIETFETSAFRDQVHAAYPGTIMDSLFQTFPGPAPTTNLEDIGSLSGEFFAAGDPDGIKDLGQVSFFSPTTTKTYQYNIRIDGEVSDNNKLFGRYIWEDQEEPGQGEGQQFRGPEHATDFEGLDAQGVVSDTHVFSPTVVNELRFGYARDTSNFVSDTRFPYMYDVSDITGFGAFAGVPQLFTGEEYHLVDVVSVNKGDHGLKFGFEYRWNQDDSDFRLLSVGYFAYNGMFDMVANLPYFVGLRVDPRQVGGVPDLVGTPHNFRQGELGWFVQDDWKVSNRLTLNLGIRYDNYGEINDTQDRIANIILGEGRDVFERVKNSTVGQVEPSGLFARDNIILFSSHRLCLRCVWRR